MRVSNLPRGRTTRTPALTLGLLAAALAGCTEDDSLTDHNTEGPPEILQVALLEDGSTEPQLAYGSHPQLPDDDGMVMNARPKTGQSIRVVFDELLLGNNLEEVICNDLVTWTRIPVGTTPTELRACMGDPNTLGVCEGICTGPDGTIGIRDGDPEVANDDDGAPDQIRLIAGVATLTCDGVDIPINEDDSYYNPSGNQLVDLTALGLNGLGPAIVITPQDILRTSAECTVSFGDEVVDKEGNRVCADGGSGCSPGDSSAISWTVAPLEVSGTTPPQNDPDHVPVTGSGNGVITATLNADLDLATLDGITLSDEAAAYPLCPDAMATGCLEISLGTSPTGITIIVRGGMTPLNGHTLTIPATLADKYGGTLPEPYVLSFTTADAPAPMQAQGESR